jgi:hypothetical protein
VLVLSLLSISAWCYMPMAELYNPAFDLDAIAKRIGYLLFLLMKPFSGVLGHHSPWRWLQCGTSCE